LTAVIIGLAQLISRLTGWEYMTSAWISAALVGIVVGIVAYVLITGALAKLKETQLTPRETVETLKEDAQWLKNQVS
jgi:flagellar motor component MotA